MAVIKGWVAITQLINKHDQCHICNACCLMAMHPMMMAIYEYTPFCGTALKWGYLKCYGFLLPRFIVNQTKKKLYCENSNVDLKPNRFSIRYTCSPYSSLLHINH